ncbi:hypothetical protein K4K59_011120 [Colletotrichum sp. SAR11_240]|nr:hypothetical protein K4K59_011120 [Colletotrichum sp. SAR11_240]
MTDRRVALTLRRPSSEAAADQAKIRALDIPGTASLIVNDAVTDLKVSAIMLDEDEFLRCLVSSSIAIGKGHNLAMLVGAVYVNEVPSLMTSFARKPIFAREGTDVVLQRDGKVMQDASMGDYGAEGYVVQELALLPEFSAMDGNAYYPVIGLWFIDGDPAGMGIREDHTPITTNTSVFVPHSIEGGPATYEEQRIPDSEEIEEQMRVAPFLTRLAGKRTRL